MSAASARLRPRTDPSAPGLAFSTADVGYGDVAIVRAVDLTVARGELVGLVGPNGAGKSTLLRAVTGSAVVLGGRLSVAGIAHDELDAPARARLVGVVPQSPPTLFAFTAREFVEMGRHAHLGRMAVAGETDDRAVERAMERTDTLRLAGERVDTLSGGDVQRLTLAQALAQDPEVLLLDEPTSHLDLNHRLQVLDLVSELAADGLAVLGVFHDLDLAARYSDRLAVVDRGGVPVSGLPERVLTAELVRRVFAVRAVVATDPVTASVAVTPVLRDEATRGPASGTVLVVCGSGTGAALMRRLTLAGFDVVPAALSAGDVDHAVAEALALPLISLPPYGVMTAEDTAAVAARAAAADVIVVCEVPFGRANLGNLEAVVSSGAPAIMIGGAREERDFAGGSALRMLDELERRGAIVAENADDAVRHVTDVVRFGD